MSEKVNYIIGHHNVFRMSQKRCQRLLYALLLCDGEIHHCHSFSIDRQNNRLYNGIQVGAVDANFSISIRRDSEKLFESITGEANILEKPPTLSLN